MRATTEMRSHVVNWLLRYIYDAIKFNSVSVIHRNTPFSSFMQRFWRVGLTRAYINLSRQPPAAGLLLLTRVPPSSRRLTAAAKVVWWNQRRLAIRCSVPWLRVISMILTSCISPPDRWLASSAVEAAILSVAILHCEGCESAVQHEWCSTASVQSGVSSCALDHW